MPDDPRVELRQAIADEVRRLDAAGVPPRMTTATYCPSVRAAADGIRLARLHGGNEQQALKLAVEDLASRGQEFRS